MINAQAVVIAGYLEQPWLRVRAGNALDEEAFVGGYKALWIYAEKLKGKATKQVMRDVVERRYKDDDAGRLVREALSAVEAESPTRHEFGYALTQVLTAARRRVMQEEFVRGAELLATDQAQAEAVARALPRKLASYSGASKASVQNVRAEARHSMTQRYSDLRLMTGITRLDKLLRGFRMSQLVLWGGYTHEAKTTFSAYCADAFAEQGANVLYVTLEMSKKQVIDTMLAVHSHRVVKREVNERGGAREVTGVPYMWFDDCEIRERLPQENQRQVDEVVSHFEEKREGRGDIRVWHPTGGVTLEKIRGMYEFVCDDVGGNGVDVLMIDYLEIVDPEKPEYSLQRELRRTLISAKDMALEARGGRGCLLWTPWQMTRQSQEGDDSAKKRGWYGMWDYAESSFAERQSDVMGWNMFLGAYGYDKLKQGICKNRTTRETTINWPDRGWLIDTNKSTCEFSDAEEVGDAEGRSVDLD